MCEIEDVKLRANSDLQAPQNTDLLIHFNYALTLWDSFPALIKRH